MHAYQESLTISKLEINIGMDSTTHRYRTLSHNPKIASFERRGLHLGSLAYILLPWCTRLLTRVEDIANNIVWVVHLALFITKTTNPFRNSLILNKHYSLATLMWLANQHHLVTYKQSPYLLVTKGREIMNLRTRKRTFSLNILCTNSGWTELSNF